MKKIVTLVLALLLTLSMLTACTGNNSSNVGGTPAHDPVSTVKTESTASESGGDDSQQEQPSAPDLPTFEPFVFSGTSDSVTAVIDIPTRYAIANISAPDNEKKYFGVHQVNGSLEDVALLVNKSGGNYMGSVLIDTERRRADGKEAFRVVADVDWEIAVTPLVAAESLSLAGTGDHVSGVFLSPGVGMWQFVHDGEYNFKVFIYSLSGESNRVVNVIGEYEKENSINLGAGFIFWVIEADGNWSITPK